MRPILAAMVLFALASPVDATTPGPDSFRCQVVAFSPNVGADRTGLCVTLDYQTGTVHPDGNATAYRTNDGGRTWRRRRSEGLRPLLSPMLKQVVFSPGYASDGAVYLHAYGRGLLRTTDGGDTWLPVAPWADSAQAGELFAPITFAVGEQAASVPALAFAAEPPAVVSPPLHVPVAGAPGHELQFLSSKQHTFAVSLERAEPADLNSARTRLYSCNAALACTTRLHEFPVGHDWQDGWLAPDFDATGQLYAVTIDSKTAEPYAWRSPDRGRTFARWTSLQAFLSPLVGVSRPQLTLALQDGCRTMFARVTHSGSVEKTRRALPPRHQVLRSDDDGRTWRRIAFGRGLEAAGPRGTLPWDHDGIGVSVGGAIEFLPDGLLVTVAGTFPKYVGVFISGDGGRSWRRPQYF